MTSPSRFDCFASVVNDASLTKYGMRTTRLRGRVWKSVLIATSAPPARGVISAVTMPNEVGAFSMPSGSPVFSHAGETALKSSMSRWSGSKPAAAALLQDEQIADQAVVVLEQPQACGGGQNSTSRSVHGRIMFSKLSLALPEWSSA